MPFLTAPDADVMNIGFFSPLKSLAQYASTQCAGEESSVLTQTVSQHPAWIKSMAACNFRL